MSEALQGAVAPAVARRGPAEELPARAAVAAPRELAEELPVRVALAAVAWRARAEAPPAQVARLAVAEAVVLAEGLLAWAAR